MNIDERPFGCKVERIQFSSDPIGQRTSALSEKTRRRILLRQDLPSTSLIRASSAPCLDATTSTCLRGLAISDCSSAMDPSAIRTLLETFADRHAEDSPLSPLTQSFLPMLP
ncbi:hypothetical protein NDU88_003248 [Pleurodeles waltl]|uniref:Uncharacterized protein n=1 Tax=Pleurodeles waltl TaxID=8319 RepID=A0AAV7MTQ4_PLEWA|nr:hypothetical protein NDU88_003248 [Pleurodeles waltl]